MSNPSPQFDAEDYIANYIKNGKVDVINQMFHDGAELHITKPGYAYIQLGSMRYYFIGKPRYKEVSTPSGKYRQEIIPYDGWEKNL